MIYKNLIVVLLLGLTISSFCQTPTPCGADPTMAPNCLTACVICDIDGYTGTNNLQSNDGGFNEFCSWPDNVHYIAFIAGSASLSIRIEVSNCNQGNSALDIGLYESLDCNDYTSITTCYDDLLGGQSTVFNTTQPLNIGQHYYLVMDGSAGAVCSWTFTVLDGSTQVAPLGATAEPNIPELICANQEFEVSISPQIGASILRWTIDGQVVSISSIAELNIPIAGSYNLCFQESNVCNTADQVCRIIEVQPQVVHDTTIVICEGDIVFYNGDQYTAAGTYPGILIPADQGCDTLATLNLDYGAIFEGDDQYYICEGDTLYLDDQVHFETGIYDHFLLTDKGCDSTVHVYLDLVVCNMQGISVEQDLLCYGDGNTGSLTFSITAGTPPFTYEWVKIFEENTTFGSGSIASDFEDVTLDNLYAGAYLITVRDNFGNFTIITSTIQEPTPLLSTLSADEYNGFNVSCKGYSDGAITAQVQGGIPAYQYAWPNGGSSSPSISNLSAGQYIVTINDSNDCLLLDTIILTEPTPISFTNVLEDPNCDGPNTGTINILPANGGVAPYIYSFNGAAFGDNIQFENLSEGPYQIVVQDANNCFDTLTETLFAAQIPELGFEDDVTINLGDSIILSPLLNAIDIGQIIWSPVDYLSCNDCFQPYAFPVNTTTFNIEITSIDECVDNANITVKVLKDRSVFAPNIFSPIASGEDQFFSVLGGKQISRIISLKVYDRWGNKVYQGSDLNPNSTKGGWDGLFDGSDAAIGVYVWVAEVEFLDAATAIYSGDISLIR